MSRGDKDGFQLVRRKGRPRPRKSGARSDVSTQYDGPAPSELLSRVEELRKELEEGTFWREVRGLLEQQCGQGGTFREFVCYGIGQFGSCRSSQWQLAMLSALSQHWKPECVWLFDPLLREEEKSVARQLGCHIIPTNELCRRQVDKPSLFFMPHCGKAMYDNLLWANWSPWRLPNVSIIGNALSSYHERLPAQQLAQEAYYIHKITPHCREQPLPSTFCESNVFNDLSLHTFPLSLLPPSHPHSLFWEHCPEPTIDQKDPEMITS